MTKCRLEARILHLKHARFSRNEVSVDLSDSLRRLYTSTASRISFLFLRRRVLFPIFSPSGKQPEDHSDRGKNISDNGATVQGSGMRRPYLA